MYLTNCTLTSSFVSILYLLFRIRVVVYSIRIIRHKNNVSTVFEKFQHEQFVDFQSKVLEPISSTFFETGALSKWWIEHYHSLFLLLAEFLLWLVDHLSQ